MKQQEGKQRARGQKSIEHFKFVDYQAEDGHKSRLKKNHPKKHKDGFARWSDYITYDSAEIEIPISDDESISVSPHKQQNSSVGETGNSKQMAPAAPTKEEVPQTNIKNQQQEKQSHGQKFVQQIPSSVHLQYDRPSQPVSPFSIPNISEIKPKESLYSHTRNSEKFLLELLNEQYGKAEQKQQSKPKPQKKQSQNDAKPQKQSEANSRKSNAYKQLDKNQQNQKQGKERQVQQVQVRPKRVTINDRGKIKFPTDSISGQFQYVLPEELRDYDSSKKRKLVIEEEQQEQKDVYNEPMDVVDLKREEEAKLKAKAKEEEQELRKAEIKLKQLAKNAPKIKLPQQKKKQKVIRVIDNKEDYYSANHSKSNESKDLPQASKKTVQIKSITGKQPKRESLANEESKVRKFKKQQVSQVEIVSRRQSTPKVYSRPKRFRHEKLPFWKNERVVYSKDGTVLGVSSLTNLAFLQIVGFHSAQSIATNKVYFSPVSIKITITLKPRQKVYSSGIDVQKMKENKLRIKNFNQIQLVVLVRGKSKPAKAVKVVIEDIDEADVKEPIPVKRGQTFSIENLSPSLSHSVVVSFHSGDS